MDINTVFGDAIKKSDGWVIVVVVSMYILYHLIRKYMETQALNKVLQILDNTLTETLASIDQKITSLITKLENYFNRL